MSAVSELGALTRNQALSIIKNELGFPRPSPKYLRWYFECNDGVHYVPKVDFTAIRKEVDKNGLVKKLGGVIHLPEFDQRRSAVIAEIRQVINDHLL